MKQKIIMPHGGKYIFIGAISVALSLLTSTAYPEANEQRSSEATPTTVKPTIYVTDFELDVAKMPVEPPQPPPPPSPLGGLGNAPPEPPPPEEPAVRAQRLVDLLSTSLVEDLSTAGFDARRLSSGEPLSAQGWLVRGVFTEVKEGDRLKRAVIGFGMGATEVQIVAWLSDLAEGAPKATYQVNQTSESSKLPGALLGAVITLSPYMAIVRLALSGKDLEKNVQQTSDKITADISQHLHMPGKVLVKESPSLIERSKTN